MQQRSDRMDQRIEIVIGLSPEDAHRRSPFSNKNRNALRWRNYWILCNLPICAVKRTVCRELFQDAAFVSLRCSMHFANGAAASLQGLSSRLFLISDAVPRFQE
jgi:hypothetical protein